MTRSIRIKMCGMSKGEDIHFAHTLGVDAIGLIFYEPSKRSVSLEKAKELSQHFPLFLNAVAVFVDASASKVNEVLSAIDFHYLQFHGQESAEFCEQFKIPYIKAIPAISREFIEEQMQEHKRAQAFLLDSPSIAKGGSGQPFDWDLIPKNSAKPIILAGGLTSENVVAGIRNPSVCAVDVCSGVESDGKKDHVKMQAFVKAIRGLHG